MTETFTASNGWHIDEYGHFASKKGIILIGDADVDKARQFFLEERDHELGRWRSKKDPSWTAVRDGEIVCFQNEDGKRSFSVNAEVPTNQWWSADSQEIEREYFKAHPQHKPLPTEDGLYVSELISSTLWAARVYRLRDGEWSDVGRPESDPEVVCVAVQEVHDDEGLVPLGIVESEDEQ